MSLERRYMSSFSKNKERKTVELHYSYSKISVLTGVTVNMEYNSQSRALTFVAQSSSCSFGNSVVFISHIQFLFIYFFSQPVNVLYI